MKAAAAASVAPAVADAGAAVAAPAPAPAPTPNYTPPPPATPPAPSMENGGAAPRSGGIKEFFSDINVIDVTISAFIVGAVIYSVQYHKFMMMLEKTGYADLSTRVQKIESAMAASKKQAEANATGNGRMRRKRGLITL